MREPLHRFADIHYGKSPTLVTTLDSEIPIYGTGGRYGSAARSLFNGPAVIVARKGSLGNPHLALAPFWASDTTYAVIPKPGIDVRWLYYSLSLFDLTKLNEATGVPSINRDWLRRIELESATPDQQRRIAEILGTVDEAIEQTEALIVKQQQVKAGLMHDLFTRGLTPDGQLRPSRAEAPDLYHETPLGWLPKAWGWATIEELLAKTFAPMRSGPFGSALLKEELVESGVPFLGIDNVFTERFEPTYRRFVSRYKFAQLIRYSVFPGDVIITIMGTVGRCCVVPDSVQEALSSKHLWTMTFDRNKVLPELVCWQLNHAPWLKRWFARHSQGAVMDAIQSSTLRGLTLPLPLIDEQRLIALRYESANATLASEEAHLTKLRQLKQGLMQDLLTGRVPVPA